MPAKPSASASRRAKRCCGGARCLEAGGGIEALGRRDRRGRRRDQTDPSRGPAAPISSTRPSSSRSARADGARSGRGSRAGRDCGGRLSRCILRRNLLTSGLFAFIAAWFGAPALGLEPFAAVALAALAWYGSEAALAWAAGWRLGLPLASGLDRARSRPALALGAGLDERRFRLARQCDDRRRGRNRRRRRPLRPS